jgi:hypothetical protein
MPFSPILESVNHGIQEVHMVQVVALPTLTLLRQHVINSLCAHDRLDPQQTQLREAIIQRRGKPCGLFFQVQGPRMLKTYAVWVGEENRVLFYDSTGARFAETHLSDAPDPRFLGIEQSVRTAA